MKIMPCMSRGIAFLSGGKIELLPLHVFRGPDGATVIRIGRNTLWFDENGRFDGEEMRLSNPDAALAERAAEALDQSAANQRLPPETPYFHEGDERRHFEERSLAALLQHAPRKVN